MNKQRLVWMMVVFAPLSLGALGCSGDDDDDATSAPLEIIGDYVDQFSGEQHISTKKWNDDAIVAHDNDKNVVYTQFADDNMFSPNLFAKTVYTEPDEDDSFHFCMVVFDAETLAAAKASTVTADDSNAAETGCGGDNPWSLATKL